MNTLKKCVKVAVITNSTKMHGQQNINFCVAHLCLRGATRHKVQRASMTAVTPSLEHFTDELTNTFSMIFKFRSRLKYPAIHKLTDTMEHNPPSEANSSLASQEITRILWDPQGSSPHSQQSAVSPYPEPRQSSPRLNPVS